VAGKPIVEYLVENIPSDLPITISTNAAFGDQFQAWITGLHRPNITLCIEATTHDDQKLGALGATAQWIDQNKIDDDILLLTGDNYLGFSIRTFLDSYNESTPLLAAFDIGEKEKASAFGTVIVDPNNPKRIQAFEEKPKEPKTSLVSTGCCIIPRAHIPVLIAFAAKHPDNVGGIFEEFLRQNIDIACFTFAEPWLDIGSFGSYLEAHRLLIGVNAHIHPHATVKDTENHGTVFVDASSSVSDSILTDCVVFEHTNIQNCVLKNCVIDTHCVLKNVDLTGKMIRAHTTLIGDLS
jgi:glucose-1-phosphate thymidylyltransferase